MKTFDIKMPKLGESITEGVIIAWLVKVGDRVQEDDILFEVTTAKVNAEIPSPVAGTVAQILIQQGEKASVGTVVMLMQLEEDSQDDSFSKETVSGEAEKSKEAQGSNANPSILHEGEASRNQDESKSPFTTTGTEGSLLNQHKEPPLLSGKSPDSEEEPRWYSPIVLQLATEAKIAMQELETIPGTGYMGRLTKRDIQEYIRQKSAQVSNPTSTSSQPAQQSLVLQPQGSQDKIEEFSRSQYGTQVNENQIIEMDPVRRIIADHMVMSKNVSPHVTTFIEADVTSMVEWRRQYKEIFFEQEGINLTYMPVITEAVARALKVFPRVNASVDGYTMILKKDINIGIAVALDNGNLVVPVVHNADKLSLSGLAQMMDGLAKKARKGDLKIDDIQGGTFTITNFGTFKNTMGTPIINQPQVAILGVGYIEKKPAVVETPQGDAIAIRHKLILSLSYDHRIVDGALGGKFLLSIANYLENWNK